jgi:uncharacterized Fe-S center protein
MGHDHDYKLGDIGIIASTDIVALDAASREVCNKAFGGDFFESIWPGFDCTAQLSHAESLGLGQRAYDLVEI